MRAARRRSVRSRGFPPVVERLEQWVERASDATAFISVLSLLLLTGVVTFAVVMRYVFNAALTWSDEISSFCMVAIVFLALGHTLAKGGHIRVDFVANMLPPRIQRALALVGAVVGLIYATLLVWASWSRISIFYVRSTVSVSDLYIPLYLPAIPLLVGSITLFLLMALLLLRQGLGVVWGYDVEPQPTRKGA